MAFRGRGGAPSINKINLNKNNSDNNSNNDDFPRDYIYIRRYYHVTIDSAYIATQIVITCIILLACIITFLVAYKPPVIDPIEDIKKTFINTYLIILGIALALSLIVNFISKDEQSLIKGLAICLIISLLIMYIFWGVKLNLDSKYDKNAFEKIYIEQNIGEISDTKTKIGINMSGMELKTEKEYFVEENIKAYDIFKIKTYGIFGANLLLSILLIYQIVKVYKIQKKKDRLDKDDIILFDEEQNVRF